MMNMPRPWLARIAPVLLAALITACADDLPPGPPRERLVITGMPVVHGIRFDPGSAVLTAAEARALEGFLQRSDLGAGDTVLLERPRDGGSAVTEQRLAAIEGLLARRHLQVGTADTAAGIADYLRVYATNYVTSIAGCPDWRELEGSEYTNTPSQNFGCASATNLSAMIARPRDLVRGADPGPGDGGALALGVARYRTDKSKQPSSEESTSGKN